MPHLRRTLGVRKESAAKFLRWGWSIFIGLWFKLAQAAESKEIVELTLEKPFKGTGDPVEWASSITKILALLILVGILAVVLFEKRWMRPSLASALRWASLCVFPLFLLLFGGFAAFEGSKEVAFCHSCHSAMDLYVADMRNPESATLAAIHYNDRYILDQQCYRCHADYGIWGTAEAKVRGLAHFYYWVSNSRTARGEEQIQLYGSYQNTLCLACHAGSQSFLKSGREVHRKFADALLGTKPNTGAPILACTKCHGPAHPKLADKRNMSEDAT